LKVVDVVIESLICLEWLKLPLGAVSSLAVEGKEIRVCLKVVDAKNYLWKCCRP